MADMTQEEEHFKRRDLKKAQGGMEPTLDRAREEMQQVIDSLTRMATILPGKNPLGDELILAGTVLRRLGAVSQDVAEVKALTDELLKK